MPAGSPDLTKEAFRAAKSGNAAGMRQIAAADPSVISARDSDGATLLHHAAWKGHPEVAALLLELGADINAQSSNTHWGGTPLHAAAHANQRLVAALLLEHGADPAALSCNGRTPLEETMLHNATAVAKLLRAAGG
jgi:ankyrin repeat protein